MGSEENAAAPYAVSRDGAAANSPDPSLYAFAAPARRQSDVYAALSAQLDFETKEVAELRSELEQMKDAQKSPLPPITLGGMLTGLIALFTAYQYGYRPKRVDTVEKFYKAYGDLMAEWAVLAEKAQPRAPGATVDLGSKEGNWWRRFFDLNALQSESFWAGVLPEHMLCDWMNGRCLQFKRHHGYDLTMGGFTYEEYWLAYKAQCLQTRFCRFMDDVHGAADSQKVARIVRSARSWLYRILE